MNSGYDRFRQQNDDVNRRAAERLERDRKDYYDRIDKERRHRETIKALGGSGVNDYSGLPAKPLSLRWIGVIFLVGVAGIIAASFLPNSESSKSKAPVPAASAEIVTPPDNRAVTSPEVSGDSTDDAETSGVAEASIPSDTPTSLAMGSDFNAAIQTALTTGDRTAWNAGPASGYISVSAPIIASGRRCRSLVVETVKPDEGQSTVPETWCEGSGNWNRQ